MVRLLDPVYEQRWFGGVVPPYEMYLDRVTQVINPQLTAWGVAANGAILVVGAAYGHLLAALRNSGRSNPWGIDCQYAKTRANEFQIQTVRDRIGVADATDEAQVRAFRTGTAGLGGPNARFAATIIEDVESTLSGATEAAALYAALRAHTTAGRIMHLITMWEPGQWWSSIMSGDELNNGYYQSPAQWAATIRAVGGTGPNAEPIINLRTMQPIPAA